MSSQRGRWAGLFALSIAGAVAACATGRAIPTTRLVSIAQWDSAAACITAVAEQKGYWSRATDSSLIVRSSGAQRRSPSVAAVPLAPRSDEPGVRPPPSAPRPERNARAVPIQGGEELVLTRAQTPEGLMTTWRVQAVDYRGARTTVPVSRHYGAIRNELDRTCFQGLQAGV